MTTSALIVALADAAEALGRAARAIATSQRDPEELLTLDEARELAKLRTTRPLKEAARRGELPLYGSERMRRVKRAELDAWLVSKRAPVLTGPVDPDLEARMARLAKTEKPKAIRPANRRRSRG